MDNLLLERILTMLDEDNHSTVFDFLVQTLRSTSPTHERHQASILTRIPDVLDLVAERSAGLLESSAVAVAAAVYQNDLLNLIQFNSGFHFKGSRACLEQLETFSVAQMGEKIQGRMPVFDSTSFWTSSSLSGIVCPSGLESTGIIMRWVA
jgi:hypothetical protein